MSEIKLITQSLPCAKECDLARDGKYPCSFGVMFGDEYDLYRKCLNLAIEIKTRIEGATSKEVEVTTSARSTNFWIGFSKEDIVATIKNGEIVYKSGYEP